MFRKTRGWPSAPLPPSQATLALSTVTISGGSIGRFSESWAGGDDSVAFGVINPFKPPVVGQFEMCGKQKYSRREGRLYRSVGQHSYAQSASSYSSMRSEERR